MQQMKLRTSAFTAAVLALLPSPQPVLLGTVYIAAAATAVALHAPTALAQDASSVARIAKAITVRIEGATQGSGVIVKKVGSQYTVLTAWHVINSNQPGEEISINTFNDQAYNFDKASIKRINNADLATLTFTSSNNYKVATIGEVNNIESGQTIYVSGFPLPSSSIPVSLWRFLKGYVIANANVSIPGGYQLLYSNPTLPGMSGGTVLNENGHLVGIHGRSERDDEASTITGKAVSTGTNQAIPITYYNAFINRKTIALARSVAKSSDDYLAQAEALFWETRRGKYNTSEFNTIVKLASESIAIKETVAAFKIRGASNFNLGKKALAISDYRNALKLNPNDFEIWHLLGSAYSSYPGRDLENAKKAWINAISIAPNNPKNAPNYMKLAYVYGVGRRLSYKEAIGFISQSIRLDAVNSDYYYKRAGYYGDQARTEKNLYEAKKYNELALRDFDKSIQLGATNKPYAFYLRGEVKRKLKDFDGAIDDYTTAMNLDSNSTAYKQALSGRGSAKVQAGLLSSGCSDYKRAALMKEYLAIKWLSSSSGEFCK